MITKSNDDESNESKRFILILLNILKHGWEGDENVGFSYLLDPETSKKDKIILNDRNFYVENSYNYVEHIADICVNFLKIILK
jgi:hypothetical protein